MRMRQRPGGCSIFRRGKGSVFMRQGGDVEEWKF